jgi:hypothetical protein
MNSRKKMQTAQEVSWLRRALSAGFESERIKVERKTGPNAVGAQSRRSRERALILPSYIGCLQFIPNSFCAFGAFWLMSRHPAAQ